MAAQGRGGRLLSGGFRAGLKLFLRPGLIPACCAKRAGVRLRVLILTHSGGRPGSPARLWEIPKGNVTVVSFFSRALSALGKIGIIIAIGLAFLFGMTGTVYLTLRSPEVTVPNILGKDRQGAEDELSRAGLNMRVRATRYSADTKADTVLLQLPRPGEVVKIGQTVAVDISRAQAKEGESSTSVASDEPKKEAEEKSENANETKNENGNQNANNQNQNNRNRNKNKNANNSNNSNNRNANNTNNRNSSNANANRPPAANNRNTANVTTNGNRTTNNTNSNRRAPATTPPLNPGSNTRP